MAILLVPMVQDSWESDEDRYMYDLDNAVKLSSELTPTELVLRLSEYSSMVNQCNEWRQITRNIAAREEIIRKALESIVQTNSASSKEIAKQALLKAYQRGGRPNENQEY